MKKFVYSFTMLLLVFNASVYADEMSEIEWDKDRIGYDYKVFQTQERDPLMCQNQCEAESQCRAWAFYVETGDCWLKDGATESQARENFATGVKVVGDISSYAVDMSEMEKGISAAESTRW